MTWNCLDAVRNAWYLFHVSFEFPRPGLGGLAVREKKVYLARLPEMPAAATRVFLDVEGVPDRDLYYLIGAVAEEKDEALKRKLLQYNEDDCLALRAIAVQGVMTS
jgi:hypothetical protein